MKRTYNPAFSLYKWRKSKSIESDGARIGTDMKLNPGVFLPEGELIGSYHSGSAPNTIVVIGKY